MTQQDNLKKIQDIYSDITLRKALKVLTMKKAHRQASDGNKKVFIPDKEVLKQFLNITAVTFDNKLSEGNYDLNRKSVICIWRIQCLQGFTWAIDILMQNMVSDRCRGN